MNSSKSTRFGGIAMLIAGAAFIVTSKIPVGVALLAVGIALIAKSKKAEVGGPDK